MMSTDLDDLTCKIEFPHRHSARRMPPDMVYPRIVYTDLNPTFKGVTLNHTIVAREARPARR
jgi:hypothetical protein